MYIYICTYIRVYVYINIYIYVYIARATDFAFGKAHAGYLQSEGLDVSNHRFQISRSTCMFVRLVSVSISHDGATKEHTEMQGFQTYENAKTKRQTSDMRSIKNAKTKMKKQASN